MSWLDRILMAFSKSEVQEEIKIENGDGKETHIEIEDEKQERYNIEVRNMQMRQRRLRQLEIAQNIRMRYPDS